MKTTLEIDESVMRKLKERAAKEGATMSGLVEAALRAFLEDRPPIRLEDLPPLPTWESGGLLVNIDNNAALRDQLDAWDAEEREAEERRALEQRTAEDRHARR